MSQPFVSLRCDLQGEVAVKFEECKRALGLETNAELVRLLVSLCYPAIVGQQAATLARVPPLKTFAIPGELLELAVKLDVDPTELAADLPEIIKRGDRTFGSKRLEVYKNGGQVCARIWIGNHVLYAVPLKADYKL
jgi:hypothetical protein